MARYFRTKAMKRYLALLCVLVISVWMLLSDQTSAPWWTWTNHHHNFPVLDEALPEDVDWSQYAYCQYATNEIYMCNSLMIFEALQRLGAKADRTLLYPEDWILGDESSKTGGLLAKARDDYSVHLLPIKIQHFTGDQTWADSFTKLLAFNQTQYTRVLSLDSDATILQSMDELFLLPSAPVAMPQAYWLDDHSLSSQVMLAEPAEQHFARIVEAMAQRSSDDFDMDIINSLYGDESLVIPHRRFDMVTGEFRANDHSRYLGGKRSFWDPDAIMNETKYIHFSDWPMPKPWKASVRADRLAATPRCIRDAAGNKDCRNQEKWHWLYNDFKRRRHQVCGGPYNGFDH